MDTNKSLRKIKDEYSVIPSRIAKGLKSVIGLKIELDQSTKARLALESLIRLFVELIGHYRTFIVSNSENKHFQVFLINIYLLYVKIKHYFFIEYICYYDKYVMVLHFKNYSKHYSYNLKYIFIFLSFMVV